MIVPEFWAEAKRRCTINNRTISVKRFGWSDTDQQAAQLLADQRLEQAVADLQAGKTINRQEHKTAYNGAEGVPIREEIIARAGDAVITRNGYGARCLNVPDVLFGDVDIYETGPGAGLQLSIFLVLLIVSAAIVFFTGAPWFVLFSVVLTPLIAMQFTGKRNQSSALEQTALTRIENFSKANPSWYMRVYKTPMGFRVLVMHAPFQAHSDEVINFFKSIGVDDIYQKMCLNQNCFRARVSAKPWRIGIAEHLRPGSGIWPVRADKLPQRQAWVNTYEATAEKFAACRFLAEFGSGNTHQKAEQIRDLHDELCKSLMDLPIA
jgi:hypothetical protein